MIKKAVRKYRLSTRNYKWRFLKQIWIEGFADLLLVLIITVAFEGYIADKHFKSIR